MPGISLKELGFALVLAFLAAPAARGQEGLDLPERGKPEESFFAGYGHWIHVAPGRTDEQLGMVQPQIGFRLGSRFEYLFEVHVARYIHPDGLAAGFVPLGARYFFSERNPAPYFGLGAGLCWTDLKVVELNRRFNFIVQASIGLRKTVTSARAWMVELRWLHYSNAGTAPPNFGLNALVLLGGWRFR